MAEQQQQQEDVDCDDVDNPNYKPPAQKSISEIQKLDAEDESLKKYKETLLGTGSLDPPKPGDSRNVIVEKLVFCSDGRDEIELDLSGDLKEVAKRKIVVKEGSTYKLKIYFYVQREIVSGLVYKNRTMRAGIQVDKLSMMVGSYGPKKELQMFLTQQEEVPKGMVARGSYTVKNKITDDDKNDYAEWEFKLEIKKDWSD